MGSPTHLSVLSRLDKPCGVRELANQLHAPYDTVYSAVRQLERQGLVLTGKAAGTVRVSAGSAVLVDRAKAVLRDVPRADWDQILRGDWPVMLQVLNRVHTARLTSEICGKSLSTVHHMIERLLQRGVLLKGGGVTLAAGKYRINPRLSSLIDFLDEMTRLRALFAIQQASSDGTLVWNLGPEILFKSEQTPETRKNRPGALSAFAESGIELYPPAPYWFISIRNPTVADFILQALLQAPDDPVNRSYAALLLENQWRGRGRGIVDELQVKSAIYDDPQRPGRMHEATSALVKYVEEHEAGEPFLPWSEHERYRRQYGLPEGDDPLP